MSVSRRTNYSIRYLQNIISRNDTRLEQQAIWFVSEVRCTYHLPLISNPSIRSRCRHHGCHIFDHLEEPQFGKLWNVNIDSVYTVGRNGPVRWLDHQSNVSERHQEDFVHMLMTVGDEW
jgi:hypothetical protein